jgi:hypothetical protein
MTDLQKLIAAVVKTAEVDESGDASLISYIEQRPTSLLGRMTFTEVLEDYLVWANGEEWERFLATAEVGDVPTGR